MATIDWTESSGVSEAVGIQRFVSHHGGLEYHVIVLDEVLAKAYGDAQSITYTNADVLKLMNVKKGDMIVSGFTYVEVAGGVAGSVPTWGITTTDPNLMGDFNPDATAGTLVNETAVPFTMEADDTLDLVVVTQILTGTGSGRWRFGVSILRVGQGLFTPLVAYVGDPNTHPQN